MAKDSDDKIKKATEILEKEVEKEVGNVREDDESVFEDTQDSEDRN